MVHEFLHDGRAVSRSKGHDIGGVEAICGFEGQYVLQPFFNCNIVIPFSEVKLAK